MTIRTPKYIVTSDRWSRDTVVVFEDEELIGGIIAEDWINDRIQATDEPVDRDDIINEMIDEFEADNDSVDESWPEHMICRSGDEYWRYDADGAHVEFLGNFDSLEDALK